MKQLLQLPHNGVVLDVDVLVSDVPTKDPDPDSDRAINPAFVLAVNREDGRIESADLMELNVSPTECFINTLLKYMLENGIPAEVRYSNAEIGASLKDLCSLCDIRLTRTFDMPEMVTAKSALKSRMQGRRENAVYGGLYREVLS